MKPDSLTQQPSSQDRSLLRNTLLQLTAVQKIICIAVVIVVALIWYDLLMRVVAFGHNIDYSGLHVLGVRGLALLRSDERRVGKGCVSTGRSSWSPFHSKKKKKTRYI